MRTFFVLFAREVRGLFYTPIAYVVLVFYLAFMGVNYQTAVTSLNQMPTEGTLVQATFFNLLFWIIYPLIFPLITMRLFADEYRMGTIESLVTAPVHDWQIVLAKFFSVLVFYVVLFAPSFLYFALFQWISGGVAPVQSAGTYWSVYLLLLLLGMFFLSIGIFASSLVRDQINAAVISLVIIVLYMFLPSLLGFLLNSTDPRFATIREFLSPIDHMRDFARGLVDTRPIVWYISMTALFLMLTHQVFQSRKLKS
jgi:ABC-2 type transport system permease protein